MTRMRLLLYALLLGVSLTCAGCRGESATEGKVKIESTEVFKKMKGVKPAPSKTPDGQ